jgi:hypothetical protein
LLEIWPICIFNLKKKIRQNRGAVSMTREQIHRLERKNIRFLTTFSILLFFAGFALAFRGGQLDMGNFPFEIYLIAAPIYIVDFIFLLFLKRRYENTVISEIRDVGRV